MGRISEGKFDKEGNFSLAWAFRIAGAIITVLIGLILAIFGFIGKKALASIDTNTTEINKLKVDIRGMETKVDFIYRWVEKQP